MLNVKEIRDENFGMIDNMFILDGDYVDDVTISVYATMRTIFYNTLLECSQFSLHDLYKCLNVDEKKIAQYQEVDNAICWLVDNGHIQLHSYTGDEVVFDKKNKCSYFATFNEDNNNGFTKVPFVNMFTLLEYIGNNKAKGFKKYQLIRYYLVIARSCSNNQQFFHIDMDTIKATTSISYQQCTKNNDLLQELGLIFYNNNYGTVVRGGSFKMNCTLFGHCNNKLDIPEVDEEFMNKSVFDKLISTYLAGRKTLKCVNKQDINNKRSSTMKKIWEDRKLANVPDVEPTTTIIEEVDAEQVEVVEIEHVEVELNKTTMNDIAELFGGSTEEEIEFDYNFNDENYYFDNEIVVSNTMEATNKDIEFVTSYNDFYDNYPIQVEDKEIYTGVVEDTLTEDDELNMVIDSFIQEKSRRYVEGGATDLDKMKRAKFLLNVDEKIDEYFNPTEYIETTCVEEAYIENTEVEAIVNGTVEEFTKLTEDELLDMRQLFG